MQWLTACLESRRSRVRAPLWPSSFKKTKYLLSTHFKKKQIQYCEKPPWPRGGVFVLRPPGLEFRILWEVSVSSHSSHHPQEVLLAKFSLHVHKSGPRPDSFNFSHTRQISLRAASSQSSASVDTASLPLSVRRWYNAETEAKIVWFSE